MIYAYVCLPSLTKPPVGKPVNLLHLLLDYSGNAW